MPLGRCLAAVGTMMAVLAVPVGAQDAGADLQAPLTADITFEPASDIVPGQPFGIHAAFRSAAGPDAPVGLRVDGWLRPISATNLPCRDAARSYRSTMALPTGSVSLNGSLLAVAMADGAVTVSDPALNLASANIVAAAKLADTPSELVADPARQRFLAVLEARGDVLSIDPLSGEVTAMAQGLDRPVTVLPAPDGGAWVLERGGGRLLRLDGKGGVAVAATGVGALAAGGDLAAYADRAGAVIIDTATGREIARFATAGPPEAVVPLADGGGVTGVAMVTGARVDLRYVDAPDDGPAIILSAPANTLRAAPDGRFLFAFDPAGGPVFVIDLARGRLVQAIAADVPIAEIGFTARAAFLLRADQASAGAIFFDTIRAGDLPQVREVVLGRPRSGPWPTGQWLAALAGGAEIVAVHAESFSGFILHDNPAMSDKSWPMTRVQLRGGEPRRIAAIDRAFRETAPGRFRTVAVVPESGTGWELVLTTGLGGQTVCAELPTRAAAPPEVRGPGVIRALPGDPLTLVLTGPDGRPAYPLQVALTFSAPQANWRRMAQAETDATGRVTQRFRLPEMRPLIITAGTAGGRAFLPLALED